MQHTGFFMQKKKVIVLLYELILLIKYSLNTSFKEI